jgi:hypothetical protein
LEEAIAVRSVKRLITDKIRRREKETFVPVLYQLTTNNDGVWGSGGIAPSLLISALDR